MLRLKNITPVDKGVEGLKEIAVVEPKQPIQMVDISGLPKPEVLNALHLNGDWCGVVILDTHRLSVQKAEEVLAENGGYVEKIGVVTPKVDLSGGEFDPTEYDNAYGVKGAPGRAQAIVDGLRAHLAKANKNQEN